MTEHQCPDCGGEGRLRIAPTREVEAHFSPQWHTCRLCGGTGRIDSTVAEVMKARRAREREVTERAEAHWLTAAVEDAFAWLVAEAGYRVAKRLRGLASMEVTYESDRTGIRISAYAQRDAYVMAELGARGNTGIPLNDCLEAHGLERISPWLPFAPSKDLVLERLAAISDALRALLPYEVGGNWYLL